MHDWERLWSDFMQEELRLSVVWGTTSNNSSKGSKVEKEEENVAIASKGKVMKGPS